MATKQLQPKLIPSSVRTLMTNRYLKSEQDWEKSLERKRPSEQ